MMPPFTLTIPKGEMQRGRKPLERGTGRFQGISADPHARPKCSGGVSCLLLSVCFKKSRVISDRTGNMFRRYAIRECASDQDRPGTISLVNNKKR